MAFKSFLTFFFILAATFSFCFAVQNFKPSSSTLPDLSVFSMEKAGWTGQKDNLIPDIINMLKPDHIFSATYINTEGIKVHLFFDYFSSDNRIGGPHSPRNCLPGSGWSIIYSEPIEITTPSRIVRAMRFTMQFNERTGIMDFWYVTRYGETSNDYTFKLYLMLSSLMFEPTDRAFIRIVSDGDPASLEALDEFERLFVDEIYGQLPID